MKFRSSLNRVRGLGAAGSGTHHWWMQRLTAVALVPLALWFVASVVWLSKADYAAAVTWLQSPFNAALLVSTIVATFYHAQLGLQVVLEDYVHTEWLKVASQITLKFACLLLGLVSVIAALRVTFGA